jgi:hypothetical protein
MDLTKENSFSGVTLVTYMPNQRTASCEEARFPSAEGCGIAHETYAGIFKRKRDLESSWSNMPLWRKRQERILLALTPQQYCTNEAQHQQEIEQCCRNIDFKSLCDWSDDQKVAEDSLSLNVDHPRMRYAEVPSLVALFNFNARTSNEQPKVDTGHDKLATLLTCMKVTGDS